MRTDEDSSITLNAKIGFIVRIPRKYLLMALLLQYDHG